MVTRKSEGGGRGNAKVEFMVTSAEGNNNSRRLLFSLLLKRTLPYYLNVHCTDTDSTWDIATLAGPSSS